MKFALLVLGFASLVFSAPTKLIDRDFKPTALEMFTDIMIYQKTIEEFISFRNGQVGPPELIWEANGCSSADDTPLGWNFKDSCNRHDFGYRNYKAQHRFTDEHKASIDLNFKKDMYNVCEHEDDRGLCRSMARLYYDGVRLFGDKRRALAEAREIDLAAVKVELEMEAKE